MNLDEVPLRATSGGAENPDPGTELAPAANACLRSLAARYVWWKMPDEAMLFPGRVAPQVMNVGTFEDLTEMIEHTGEDYLRGVLQR